MSKFDDFCGRHHWRLAPTLSMPGCLREELLCDCSPSAHCSWGLWVYLTHTISFLSINLTSLVPPTEIVPLTTTGYTLPLCTNIMVTGFIAGRIWYMSRIPVVDEHGKPVILKIAVGGRLMMLIIESGALYMVTQLIFVVLVAIRNSAEAVLSLAGTQIYVSHCAF
ncbi:hypothetical protein EV702DRAFT_460388 [Suillus placidus]|uniref:Uncharacterized protein n=1 Tax=Suillus placidus TaxID=48579 RepID=A0A9P6ZQY5_9AGAM|nr:hypothetical protein EV702DRAFT_460388 [Suillus placidus]